MPCGGGGGPERAVEGRAAVFGFRIWAGPPPYAPVRRIGTLRGDGSASDSDLATA